MKYLIACLGNIGVEYENTRHNIGFKAADALVHEAKLRFTSERYGSLAELKYKGRTLLLLKPSTYVNLSGKAVSYWLQAEKISVENLLVVLDDIALPFGSVRLRSKGSDGGHNGLKNITLTLGHENYARLRCGVGSNFGKGQQVDYVLGDWSEEEEKALPDFLKKIADAIKALSTLGVERAMNIVNTK